MLGSREQVIWQPRTNVLDLSGGFALFERSEGVLKRHLRRQRTLRVLVSLDSSARGPDGGNQCRAVLQARSKERFRVTGLQLRGHVGKSRATHQCSWYKSMQSTPIRARLASRCSLSSVGSR